MKQGWTYKKFKDICYSISDGDWIEKKDQSLSGIRLIQTGNIGVGVFLPKEDSKRFISEETFKRLRCSEIFEGDVLISRLPNPLGRSCCLPKLSTKCITAVDCSILNLNKDLIIPQYFIYYTQSDSYFSEINSQSSGTTRARITRKKLEETQIPLAPLSEQQRIVKRLDSAFAHIDELKANAEKQVNEARALFQKALSKAMEPKEGWEEKTLKEIGITQTGTTPSKNEASNYGDYIPFIRPSEIDFDGSGNIEYNSEIKLSEKGLSNGRLFKKESILMVCIGATIGKVGFCTQDVSCNQQINVLTPKEEYDFKFLYYAMRNQAFQAKVIKDGTSAQATLPIINKGKWEKLSMFIPPLSEQQRIVERLDSLSENVKALEENQRKVMAECDALKQALLRRVFE